MLYLLIGGFLFGVFFDSLVALDIFFYGFLILLAFCLFLGGFFSRREKSTVFLLFAFFIFAFVLGVLRFDLSRSVLNYELPTNRPLFFEGVITEELDYRENTTLLTVSLSKIGEEKTKTKILVFMDAGVSYKYGEKVSMFGELEKPKNFETDTGRIFDYEYIKGMVCI